MLRYFCTKLFLQLQLPKLFCKNYRFSFTVYLWWHFSMWCAYVRWDGDGRWVLKYMWVSCLIWSVSLWLLLLCSGERSGCLTGELKVEWVQLASQLISVSFELCGGERKYIYYCSCWFLCHPKKIHSPKAILGHHPHLLWTCERSYKNSLCLHILVKRSVCPTICKKIFPTDTAAKYINNWLKTIFSWWKNLCSYNFANFVRRLIHRALTFLVLGCKSLYQLMC